MNKPKPRQLLLWTAITLLSLLLLTRIALPYAVQYSFSTWFEQQSITAHIDNVSFDFTGASITLEGIQASKDSLPVLALNKLILRWSWPELLDNHAHILSITLDGLSTEIIQNGDGNTIIAGLDLNKLSETPEDNSTSDNTDKKPSEWLIQLDNLDLSKFNICYNNLADGNMDYCSRFDKFLWQGEIRFDLSQLTETITPLFVNGQLSLKQFELHNNKLKRNLLGLQLLTLNTVAIETPDSINIKEISLHNAELLQRSPDDPQQQITRFDALTIKQLALDTLNHLNINSIDITNHQTLILVKKDKKFELDEWLPQPINKKTAAIEQKPGKPFDVIIGSVNYETKQATQFIDNSHTDPFAVTLKDIKLNVTDINNSKPDQNSNISYSATHDEHGKIQLNGTITPFADKLSFDIKGKLSGLDLRSINAFTKDAIGHSIKSGQLDANLKLTANKSVLNSAVDLSLFHFELKALSKEDAKRLNTELGIPLNPSLLLLKEKDNSIHLTIPITGDLKNPSFDPNDAIKTALKKAITKAILNFYTPYGVADALFSLATALRFEPVNFVAGSHEVKH